MFTQTVLFEQTIDHADMLVVYPSIPVKLTGTLAAIILHRIPLGMSAYLR